MNKAQVTLREDVAWRRALVPAQLSRKESHLFDTVDMVNIDYLYRYLIHEDEVATYPGDWWQAFKLRWFPRWFLRWWPVRYTKVVAKHKFPEAKIPWLGREYVSFREEP